MDTSRTSSPQELNLEVWDRPFVKAHRSWCDDFVLELRQRDVPGARIGERLAEVESHCLETGQDPQAAFGAPLDYAREAASAGAAQPDAGIVRVTILSLLALVVFLLGQDAVSRWSRGEVLAYNAVEIAATVVLLAGVALAPLWIGPALRRWALGAACLIGLLGVGVLRAAARLLPLEPVVSGMPTAPVAIVGFVVVCLLALLVTRALSDDDRVSTPLAPAAGARRRGTGRPPVAVAAWILPCSYLLLSGLSWLTA